MPFLPVANLPCYTVSFPLSSTFPKFPSLHLWCLDIHFGYEPDIAAGTSDDSLNVLVRGSVFMHETRLFIQV